MPKLCPHLSPTMRILRGEVTHGLPREQSELAVCRRLLRPGRCAGSKAECRSSDRQLIECDMTQDPSTTLQPRYSGFEHCLNVGFPDPGGRSDKHNLSHAKRL